MLRIFLKDKQKFVDFTDYPSDEPVKFVMNFKKIFPSIADFLLPVLPNNEKDLSQITWESNEQNFNLFKRLIQEWTTIELRLTAMSTYKNQQFANTLVKQAQEARKKFQSTQTRLNLLHADYVFLQAIHSVLDAEFVALGTAFYLPTLRQNWQQDIPAHILNIEF